MKNNTAEIIKAVYLEQMSLYFKDSRSDKEYHVQLLVDDDGHRVNFQYGRVGSTLQTGSKTQSPVDYDKAKKLYDKLVKAKMSKGYRPGEAGSLYQNTEFEANDSGLRPQLLNPVDDHELARLLNDDSFAMQEKKNGERLILSKVGSDLRGINRKGLYRNIPQMIAEQALSIPHDFIADGEIIGERLYLFDLMTNKGISLRSDGFVVRFNHLKDLYQRYLATDGGAILLVDMIINRDDKVKLLNSLRDSNMEGVVFKRSNAPYIEGRPNSGGDALKFKFYYAASCVVVHLNAQRSVGIAVYNGNTEKESVVSIGNVFIPSNVDIPNVGDIIEVRYMYWNPGGSLYQPIYLNPRNDIDYVDCLLKQLVQKGKD